MILHASKAAVDKEWEKLEKISAWNLTKVRSKKEVIEDARTSGTTVHFASLMDRCHPKNAELEAKHQKLQRSSRIPRWHCERWFRIIRIIYWTRIISITNDRHKSWTLYQDYLDVQDKQHMQYSVVLTSKWKMHRRHWKFQNQNAHMFWIRRPVYVDEIKLADKTQKHQSDLESIMKDVD